MLRHLEIVLTQHSSVYEKLDLVAAGVSDGRKVIFPREGAGRTFGQWQHK
jgi:hypothetical protein